MFPVPRTLALSFVVVLAASGWGHADVTAGLAALDEGKVPEAAKQFQAAWDAGDADGAFYLGRLFELGVGIEADLTRAAQLYAVGAESGSARAKNRYGLMFIEGRPVLKDFERGTKLVCEAAAAGDANGQFNCGVSHADGLGVPVDPAKAQDWWRKAADQGQIAATNYLARDLLAQAAPDKAAALALFEKTGAQGNPMGLFETAKLLAEDPKADQVKAYAFANLAAARFHPEAAALRDRIEAGLDATQIAEAQKLSRDWKVVPAAQAADQ